MASFRAAAAAGILLLTAFFLFYNLGAYRLWDDEAAQAMLAEQVARTGDTSALVGRNIIAYNQGAELSGFYDRANSPLPSYLAAPFVGSHATDSFRPRLPFALCGAGFVLLFLRWLWLSGEDRTTWLIFGMALAGNVAMYLYFRQARYYGITLLCSLAIGFLYWRWDGSIRQLIGLSLLMFCVLASHLITYAGTVAVLSIDYLGWRRKERRLGPAEWTALIVPQAVLGSALLCVWNPFKTGVGAAIAENTIGERATLFWWNLRDFNSNEFGCTLLLLAAPVAYWIGPRRSYFLRGPIAILVYCAAIAVISPKVLHLTWPFADVRYLTPLIPLSIALAALTLRSLIEKAKWLALPIGLTAFGTNLFNFGPLLDDPFHEGVHDDLHATPIRFVRELLNPVAGPYGEVLDWLRANAKPGESIWVLPGWDNYPLMYHAPQFIYAWQLPADPPAQFLSLDEIHFFGILPPDLMIAFGPYLSEVRKVIAKEHAEGVDYVQVGVLKRFWMNVHKPSIIHHAFETPTRFDPKREAIYLFRRRAGRP